MGETREVPVKRKREVRPKTYGGLTTEQAADWLGVSVRTFQKLPIRRVDLETGGIRYDVKDLQFYLDTHGNTEPVRKLA